MIRSLFDKWFHEILNVLKIRRNSNEIYFADMINYFLKFSSIRDHILLSLHNNCYHFTTYVNDKIIKNIVASKDKELINTVATFYTRNNDLDLFVKLTRELIDCGQYDTNFTFLFLATNDFNNYGLTKEFLNSIQQDDNFLIRSLINNNYHDKLKVHLSAFIKARAGYRYEILEFCKTIYVAFSQLLYSSVNEELYFKMLLILAESMYLDFEFYQVLFQIIFPQYLPYLSTLFLQLLP